ncbi:MAG: ArnT family glycosyltransferase [Anaerolineae bacterium]
MRSAWKLYPIPIAFLILGLAYGVIIPPFENLDEIEHFGVIRYIAETGRLPVYGTPAEGMYHYRQEASQPPLYHLLSAGLVRLLGLQAPDAADFWRFNPRVACGPNAPSLYDNRANFYHNPHREDFPWRGTLLMLHVLRAWSTVLQMAAVAGTYALARRMFPQSSGAALLATAIVAFNPQFLLVASGVNNDNLVTPLATVALYLLVRTMQEGLSWKRSLLLGALVGMAGLSKLSGWLLLPLSAAVLLAWAIRTRQRWLTPFIVHLGLLVIPALTISGWWFWRNQQLYGDPTALAPMLELVGLRQSPISPLNEFGLMFRSFWGQIPCSFYPAGFYIPYALLTAGGTIGLVRYWQRAGTRERWNIITLIGWTLLVITGWVRWDSITPAPGGRLLFPALPAMATLWAIGLGSLGRSRLVTFPSACGLALLAWWTVGWILPNFFAPPTLLDPARARWTHPANAVLGDSVHLYGYDVALDERRLSLDVTLYWQANAPIREDYIMALQLVSPVPGDNTLRWTYDSWPGRGNYPTSAWKSGRIIRDRYRFRLPAADFPTQAWDLQLVLYEETKMTRLPVSLEGIPAGDRLVLGRYRLPGRKPQCPASGRLAADVRLGESVALTHAVVIPDETGVQVTLCWQSIAALPADYHVFVHLYDASGNLLAAGDGPPMNGAFPSSLWEPGDIISDTHHLPSPPEGARIAVGLYRLEDGVRLPVAINGAPVPDAAIPIWPTKPQ